MKSIVKKSIKRLHEFLSRYCAPSQEEIVSKLVAGTSALELTKEETRELAPLTGIYGPFVLSGTLLPVFEYVVFEEKIMEFVKVRVEVSYPSRIHFKSVIHSTSEPKRHGEEIEMTESYKEPFTKLSNHLYNYFPLYVSAEKRGRV